MNYLARINPKYMAAMHLFAAKDDVRYYLNGVCVEKHPQQGAILIATNGHYMAAIHDPDGWADQSCIIVPRLSKRLLAACAKQPSNKQPLPTQLWIADKAAVLAYKDEDIYRHPDPFGPEALMAERLELVDAKFPDWRRVANMRELDTGEALARPGGLPYVAAHLLATFHDAALIMAAGGKKYGTALQLDATGESTSVVVRYAHHELGKRFLGLVMPMRADGPRNTELPSWARQPQAAEVPA